MKKKTFLVFILFLTWLNYLLSYEYVKTMMDTADASKVSNTIVLLVFPIMWNYGAAIIKIISSIVLLIITLIYQTNEYVDIRNEMISGRSDAFFVRENGERLYKNLVYNLVKRNLSKVATLKKKSPHVLRHTFATTMLNNEAELGVVKELLGHESITTTEIYTHATFEELKKVYEQAHPRA